MSQSEPSPDDELTALAVIDALRMGLLSRVAYCASGTGGVLTLWGIHRLGMLPIPVGSATSMLVIGAVLWAVSLVGVWKLDDHGRLNELEARVGDEQETEVTD
jgi:hypothetical protein